MNKILIIFLIISNLLSAQQWNIVDEMKRPVAGGEIYADQDQQLLFVLGGYSDSLQSNVNWIQYYPSWQLDSMETPRFGFVVDSYNDQAIFYGGITDESVENGILRSWGWDFTEGVFDSNNIFNRIFSTGHVVDNSFYIIGGNPLPGTLSDTLSYLVEYDLVNFETTFSIDTVFALDQLPEQQMSVLVGTDIFIFGGIKNGISQDIHRFNTVTKVYEKLDQKLLEPRAGGKAIKLPFENTIYIIGGYNESLEALSSVEIFNVDDYSITPTNPLNEARYHFMAGIFDDKIYVMGGFDSDQNVVSSIEKLFDGAVTLLEEKNNEIPANIILHQNYPNPFNPTTTIVYEIPNKSYYTSSKVSIKIFDIIGNEIATITNKKHNPGRYSVTFNAEDLPSGIYYYQLKSESFIQTKKMVLVK